MVCTFFGHRDSPTGVADALRAVLIDLIEKAGVNEFLIGNQGVFDQIAANVLKGLKMQYTEIRCTCVCAYMPTAQQANEDLDTVYPEEVAMTPPRFAIDRRNRWMLERADIVVVYVKSPVGGAAKFKAMAERKKKMVINLAE